MEGSGACTANTIRAALTGRRRQNHWDRFWSKVEIKDLNDPDSCWEWVAAKYTSGYGLINYTKDHKSTHRVSYEISYDLTESLSSLEHVCHHCDNPPCVRPDHLFLGTKLDNFYDMYRKGRMVHKKGDKSHNAVLSNAQAAEIRSLYDSGVRTGLLASEFKVSKGTILNIVRGRTYLVIES